MKGRKRVTEGNEAIVYKGSRANAQLNICSFHPSFSGEIHFWFESNTLYYREALLSDSKTTKVIKAKTCETKKINLTAPFFIEQGVYEIEHVEDLTYSDRKSVV